MSKIKQLVFTSTPTGLEPGRSGYCTVARSQDLSKKEIREIEKLSVLDYSISKSSPPKIYSFRIVQTKSSFFYLLSRIKSCGIDYSNRTNYIAHHLIIEPELIKNLPSPSEIFQFWEGWKDNWEGNPKYLHDDLISELSKLNPENQSSCNSWQVWTGDSKSAKIPLKGHSIFRTQKNEEDKLINLFSESCSSLDQKENSWNYTFTTFLQLTDDSVDFIWIGGWENSPADKIGITPEIHFFDLDRFDESLIHETELPITKEVQEETNSPSLQSEENTTNLESEIKDRHQSDEPNVKESSIFEESITEEIPVLPLEVESKETTDASSWKPEQQEPTYKPVENVPIEQSNEQITEQTQSAKSLTKLESNKKPKQVSVKTIKPLSRTQKPKDLSIQKKKNLNVTPGKQFPIITIPFFIVSFVLFCIIFFLLGKVNELEKQNDQLNGLIKKFFEPSYIRLENYSPQISSTGPFDIPGQSRTNPKLTNEEISNNFIAGGNNVTTQVIEQIDESITKDHSNISKNLISNELQIPDLQDNGLGVTPRISERISLRETSNIIENSENKFYKFNAKKGLPRNVFDSDYDTFFETPDLLSTHSYQGFVTIIFESLYTLQKGKLEITFKISESRGGRSVQVLREDNQKIDSWETLPFGNLPEGNIKQTHSISITHDYSIKGIRLSYRGRSSFKQTLRVYEIKGSWKKSAFPSPEITTNSPPNDLPDLKPIDNPKPPRPPGFRTWTNKNGIKITAKLIQIYKDKIKIKRIDGAEFISTITTFSKEDQEFVKNIKEKQANIQVLPPQVPLVNKPKPIPVNRPNPKFNDYPKGLHDRTWTDKGGNKIQAYVWGYVPEADAICLVKNTPDGPNLLYPKISEMKFSVADENYLKAFTTWRESVLRPYREKLPEMVRIPAGKFLMGSPPFEEGRKSDETQHEVTISNDFLMGKYEITVGQWLAVMGESIEIRKDNRQEITINFTNDRMPGPWFYRKPTGERLNKYVSYFFEETPAVGMFYKQIIEFCKKLTLLHHKASLIPRDVIYRLPTEAEWEYAIRAGTTTAYFWGNNRNDGKQYGMENHYRKTEPKKIGGSRKPNPWGLYDMVGSVNEFILDQPRNYDSGGTAFNKSALDPIGSLPKLPKFIGVVNDDGRIGYWTTDSYEKSGQYRIATRPHRQYFRDEDLGFRIVLAKPIK